jgi:hypothetical protein
MAREPTQTAATDEDEHVRLALVLFALFMEVLWSCCCCRSIFCAFKVADVAPRGSISELLLFNDEVELIMLVLVLTKVCDVDDVSGSGALGSLIIFDLNCSG